MATSALRRLDSSQRDLQAHARYAWHAAKANNMISTRCQFGPRATVTAVNTPAANIEPATMGQIARRAASRRDLATPVSKSHAALGIGPERRDTDEPEAVRLAHIEPTTTIIGPSRQSSCDDRRAREQLAATMADQRATRGREDPHTTLPGYEPLLLGQNDPVAVLGDGMVGLWRRTANRKRATVAAIRETTGAVVSDRPREEGDTYAWRRGTSGTRIARQRMR